MWQSKTKNEVVKRTVYDEFVQKVNAIQTTDTTNLVDHDHIKVTSNKIKHLEAEKETN